MFLGKQVHCNFALLTVLCCCGVDLAWGNRAASTSTTTAGTRQNRRNTVNGNYFIKESKGMHTPRGVTLRLLVTLYTYMWFPLKVSASFGTPGVPCAANIQQDAAWGLPGRHM